MYTDFLPALINFVLCRDWDSCVQLLLLFTLGCSVVVNIDKSRHLVMMLKKIGRPPSWIFKIKLFNNDALGRLILYHCTKFLGDQSYYCSAGILRIVFLFTGRPRLI